MAAYKPSITYWNRLEPRPRSASIKRALAAQVRDPLWMLGRQWQMGEFQGEDAGSPAFAEVADTRSPMVAWRTRGGAALSLDGAGPLEKEIGGEPPALDLALRAELGQVLESLLLQAGGVALVEELRAGRAIAPVSEEELAAMPDQALARFLRVCGGRVVDGVEIYLEARDSLASVPDAALRRALARFVEWVEALYGRLSAAPAADPGAADLGAADPPAWQPDRLEYDAEVVVTLPDGSPGILGATPTSEGDLAWYGFDQRMGAAAAPGAPDGETRSSRWRMLPANARFRGMPKARWWEFEEGTTDFGEIKPDKRDLSRLVLMDFMLVHSNDWFLLPIELEAGWLCRIDALVVQDVFGTLTRIERAGTGPKDTWAMFATSVEGDEAGTADFFLLPLTASAALQPGPTLEEVQFLRDEMANMVWAVEHLTEDGTGRPWPGHERALAGRGTPEGGPVAGAVNPQEQPGLVYRIQTEVPEHWVPFLPVLVDAASSQVALERAALYRTGPQGGPEPVEPLGRLLRPAASPYRIHEEEVPRSGLRVLRTAYRTRWIDGSTHTWVARRKMAGRGEGRSGLWFDRAEPETGEP